MRRALLAILLAAPLLVAAAAPTEAADYVTHPSYLGFRAKTTRFCVEDRTTFGVRSLIHQATAEIVDKTVARGGYRPGFRACTSAANTHERIIVVNGRYGSGWLGTVDAGPICSSSRTYHCLRWGQTPAGAWTWLHTRYVVVKLNTSYRLSWGGWDHVITHELVHAMLAIRDQVSTCDSVIAHSGCPWKRYVTAWDTKTGNAIMRQ